MKQLKNLLLGVVSVMATAKGAEAKDLDLKQIEKDVIEIIERAHNQAAANTVEAASGAITDAVQTVRAEFGMDEKGKTDTSSIVAGGADGKLHPKK